MNREEKIELAWSFSLLQNEDKPDAGAVLNPDGGHRTLRLPDWEQIPYRRDWLMNSIRVVLEMLGSERQRGGVLLAFAIVEVKRRDGARA